MPYNVERVADVLPLLDAELLKMRADPERSQLADISSDDAYELGYEAAIHDVRHYHGDDPREVKIVSISTPDSE